MNIVKKFKTVALLGLSALLLTGCGPNHEERVALVSKAMAANLQSEFTHFEFEQHRQDGTVGPVLRYSGQNSRILATSAPQERTGVMDTTSLRLRGLAVTKSGNYFTFIYESKVADIHGFIIPRVQLCLESQCRRFEAGSALSRDAAMLWYLDSPTFTPESFRDFFGVEAPGRIDA